MPSTKDDKAPDAKKINQPKQQFSSNAFFHKITMSNDVATLCLDAPTTGDNYDYFTTQEMLLLIDDYIESNRADAQYDTSHIVLIDDDAAFSNLKTLLTGQRLAEGQNYKILLKSQANQPLAESEKVAQTAEQTRSISINTLYIQNDHGILKVFIQDTSNGLYFYERNAFNQLNQVLTTVGLAEYENIQIIVSSVPVLSDWPNCFIHAITALDYFVKSAKVFFDIIQPNLVTHGKKQVDARFPHVFILAIDKTPASLLPSPIETAERMSLFEQLPGASTADNQIIGYRKTIFARLKALNILNGANKFHSEAYHLFIQRCLDRGLITAGNLSGLLFSESIEEYIFANHYKHFPSTHYSGLAPDSIDYLVLKDIPNALTDAFKQTRFYQTLQPVQYTDDYRQTYFTVEHAMATAHKVRAPENRTVLWSGGYIPDHKPFYGLGRIGAEAGAVYLNSMMHKVDIGVQHNDFCTVAMTDAAYPVLNPIWDDPETPLAVKYAVTPHYIIAFAKNANGTTLSLNVDDTDTDSFFRRNELSIVNENTNITHVRIIRIETDTHLPIFIHLRKKEWLEFQRDQWVKSIIIRTELVMQESEKSDLSDKEHLAKIETTRKRMNQALIEECKESLCHAATSIPLVATSERMIREDARLAAFATLFRKRGSFFDDAFDAKSMKKIKLAKFRYYAKLVKMLTTQFSHIEFNQDRLIEIIDPIKRSRNIHASYFPRWEHSFTKLNYFDWLDIVSPESKYPSLPTYLPSTELHRYVVSIDKAGKLVQHSQLLDTQNYQSNCKEFALFFWVIIPELSSKPMLIVTEQLMLDYKVKIMASGLIRIVNGKITHISLENDYIKTH